jgi:dihydrolipoamide dehydrogenase
MSTYDLVVIGAGPGGYVCAIRAAQLGLKTALVDKRWLGGVCLNVGCIPTKALLKSAEVALTLREGGREFGFSFDNLQLDYAAAVRRSRKISERLTRGVGFLMKKNQIDVIMGEARLEGPGAMTVTAADGTHRQLSARNIVLATGAHPAAIPGITPDGERIVTYLEAIVQETLPESVVIIGGGAIGVEFATLWNAYGAEVTLVEMLPRILPLEDPDVSAEVAKAYRKRGINILAGHRLAGIEADGAGVLVRVEAVDSSEGSRNLKARQALIATGFRPNTTGLGLEAAGVTLTDRGFIAVDGRMATSAPGIWAVGDVTGKVLLAHVASAQGILCAEAVAGHQTMPLDYAMMPRATYAHPQAASFGLTQQQAEEAGLSVVVSTFPFLANGKALGLGEGQGFARLVAEAESGRLLGAHLVGPDVSELLPELILAQRAGLSAAEIARSVHAHPTLSEVLMEAAHGVDGMPLHI